MVRNEEGHIKTVIKNIKNQRPIPPEHIFVIQDGSTDNTKEILDSIEGIHVEHIDRHPPSFGAEFWTKRNKLMWCAEKNSDYILCMDGDTHIPETYVFDIIERMRRDNVVAAHGFDRSDPYHTLVESGMVIKTDWLRKHRAELPAINFIVCASVTGMYTAVYYDVDIRYMRKTGTWHNTELYDLKGRYWKALGHSLGFVLYQSIRLRNVHYLLGYMRANPCKKNEFTAWIGRWERDIARHKIFRKRKMSRKTLAANYILPQKTSKNGRSVSDLVWQNFELHVGHE